MSFIPSHKIYASNGSSLIYTIEDVIRRDPALSIAVPDYIEHTNLRSEGSLIVPGGNKSYNMVLTARLGAVNYTALMTALANLQSTIAVNTHYYLKIDTSDSTTDDIKVIRLEPIQVDKKSKLNKFLYYTITFKCLSW